LAIDLGKIFTNQIKLIGYVHQRWGIETIEEKGGKCNIHDQNLCWEF
jgi:hypothetical protein